MLIAQAISGAGILMIAFGGAIFGAVATALIIGYAWNVKVTEQERWLNRFRNRVRRRLERHEVEDEPHSA